MAIRESYFDRIRREIEGYRRARREFELYRSGKILDLVRRYYEALKGLKV